MVNHFGQFVSVNVKKKLRKSQAQFREKLRKLRLSHNYGFLIKKDVWISTLEQISTLSVNMPSMFH